MNFLGSQMTELRSVSSYKLSVTCVSSHPNAHVNHSVLFLNLNSFLFRLVVPFI